MNIKQVLQVHRKVEIKIINSQTDADVIIGQSLIQELHNDLIIMVPMKDVLETGDKVMVSILSDDSRYTFKSEVTDIKIEAGIKYIWLEKPHKLTTSERRNLVRTKTLLPIKYIIIQKEEENHWEKSEPIKTASIIDLSGRGISLLLNQPLTEDILVVLSIPIEINDIKKSLKLLGKVVRCEQNNGLFRIGIKFEKITENQEDLIMRYVFYTLRRYIQVARDDY